MKVNTNTSSIAAEISGISAKDLISSEERHRSFNNAFVRIVSHATTESWTENFRKQLRDREGLLTLFILSVTP